MEAYMIRVMIPYRNDKNLGLAYNECMQIINDDDWACFIDHDSLFLTPDAIRIIDEYTKKYPDTGIFTCWTNRIGCPEQRLGKENDDNDSMVDHMIMAEQMKENLFEATELKGVISGFLMVISKKTWNEIKFAETGKALGVDNDYSLRILSSGRKILRMESIYVWHSYRLVNGVGDKSHLR